MQKVQPASTSKETSMTQNPIILLSSAAWLMISGRIRHPNITEAKTLVVEGETFIPFRKFCVDPPRRSQSPPQAIFQVRFSFKNLSAAANRRLSLIPIPLILAQPGFRSKTWLLGQESGDFIGHYENLWRRPRPIGIRCP